ncbi:hypothetical protein LINPERHAP1_LOCUS37135 [Linum perenne]
MKNPYKKGKVHPTPSQSPPPPPPPSAATTAAFLSLLPAAILSLAAALSPQDKEVLAYLISSCHISAAAGQRKSKSKEHAPTFECSCFRCYTTFWARWDASPNRHVIHDIIEAYEDSQMTSSPTTTSTRQRRSRKRSASRRKESGGEMAAVEAVEKVSSDDASFEDGGDGGDVEKSAVRKIVSFVGDRISGIFGA